MSINDRDRAAAERCDARPRRRSLDFASALAWRARSRCCSLSALLAFLPGFFQIPPIDRDEARFAQATKQMVESGDYVDIRFQDEVRYKKPVGIYWLQAGVVKAASALGFRDAPHHDLALSRSLAGRRDRRGAADLLDGARLRLAARRRARRPDDGELDPARRRGARSPRPTRCCCSPSSPPWARWRAPISAEQRERLGRGAAAGRGGVLDRARRRRAAQGTADPDDRRSDRR